MKKYVLSKKVRKYSDGSQTIVALLHLPNNECTPFVVAYGYNEDAGEWSQGHYFLVLEDAFEYYKANYKGYKKIYEY